MAASLTKEQLFARIIAEDAAKVDLVSDTRRMSAMVGSVVEGGRPEIVIDIDTPGGVQSFVLNDHAKGQVATDLAIPRRYFDRMLDKAPDLLRVNVDHWLHQEPKRKLFRGFRPEGGSGYGEGRGWLSDRFKRLDNIGIAKHLLPVFDEVPGLTFHNAQITPTHFYLRCVLPKFERQITPKVGDAVQAGVSIRNSEVGSGMLAIEPFLLKLSCTNGMTVKDPIYASKTRHVGSRIGDESAYSVEAVEADDKAFWLVARDELKNALSEVRFNEIVDRLQEIATGDTIQAPVAATETLAQKFNLTEEERDTVLANLVKDGDLTQWGLLNAVTAAAHDAESFDRRDELESIGWDIAQLGTQEFARIAVAA